MLKKSFALAMTFFMLVSALGGCKSGKPEYDESIITITSDIVISDENNNTDSTGADKTSSGSAASGSTGNTGKGEVRDLGGRTITYVTYWSEPEKGKTDRETLYWKKKTEIEKKYNCKFKHVTVSLDNYDSITASIMSGKPICDVLSTKAVPYPAMKQGLFYDLSQLNEIDLSESKWYKHVTNAGTLNGKKYLMEAGKYRPNDLILYNKDVFSAQKQEDLYTLQKNGKLTTAKLIEIMRAISGNIGKPSAAVDVYPFNLHIGLVHAYGGTLVSKKDGTLDFTNNINSTVVSNAFKDAQKLINDGIVESSTGGSGWTYAREQFLKGNYPILIGNGNIENIAANCSFNLGACVFPTSDGGKTYAEYDLQWAAIPYNASKPHDIALVWNDMADVIFDVNYKSRYQDIVSSDIMEMMNAQSDYIVKNGFNMDYYGAIDIWSDGVGGVFNQMVAGTVTPANAIQTVEPLINAKLKSLK